MRLVCFIACLISAGWFANMAMGKAPSDLLQPGALWLYWIVAVAWVVNGVSVMLRGVE